MNRNTLLKYLFYAVALIILTGLAGSSGTYGSFKRDKQVFEAFENNQVSKDYKYFYNGQHNKTYAILGINSEYRLESKFWREVEPNTEEFRKLTSRI